MSEIRCTSNRWLGFAGIAIASFLGCIDFTIVNTVLPEIQKTLSTSLDQTQWIITAFVVGLASFMVLAGRLADVTGRRQTMYLGMLIVVVASTGAGLSSHLGMLLAWRVLQGLAAAMLYTASATLVADLFPEGQKNRALGLLFGVNGLGLAAGPVLGGILVQIWSWRAVFLLNVPLMVLAFLLCIGRVATEPRASQRPEMDVQGGLLFTLVIACALIALNQGDQWGWHSHSTLLLICLTIAFTILFVLTEKRADNPILSLSLLAKRPVRHACMASAALAFFYCTAFFFLSGYLFFIRQQTSLTVGWLLLPVTASTALISPIAGRLVDRYGAQRVMIQGFFCLALSAAIQLFFQIDTPWPIIFAGLIVFGLGWGLILGPSSAEVLAAVSPAEQGSALGAAWTFHNLGGAIGLVLSTAISTMVGLAWGRQHAPRGMILSREFLAKLAGGLGENLPAISAPGTSVESLLYIARGAFLAGYHTVMLSLLGLCLLVIAMLAANGSDTSAKE